MNCQFWDFDSQGPAFFKISGKRKRAEETALFLLSGSELLGDGGPSRFLPSSKLLEATFLNTPIAILHRCRPTMSERGGKRILRTQWGD